jgi:hypothetical protein
MDWRLGPRVHGLLRLLQPARLLRREEIGDTWQRLDGGLLALWQRHPEPLLRCFNPSAIGCVPWAHCPWPGLASWPGGRLDGIRWVEAEHARLQLPLVLVVIEPPGAIWAVVVLVVVVVRASGDRGADGGLTPEDPRGCRSLQPARHNRLLRCPGCLGLLLLRPLLHGCDGSLEHLLAGL